MSRAKRSGDDVVGVRSLLVEYHRTKRATPRTQPIMVEDAGVKTWESAGRRLRELDPERFRRLMALTQAFIALREPELESDEAYAARCAEIAGRRGGVS